jgi:hypothetical protein
MTGTCGQPMAGGSNVAASSAFTKAMLLSTAGLGQLLSEVAGVSLGANVGTCCPPEAE